MNNTKLLITTVPFGENDPTPIQMLKDNDINFTVNPLGRKLQPDEVASMLQGFNVVIAGTEAISGEVINACPELKAICRVGIGLDSVDLITAQEKNIAVSYTPDGPTDAVVELTIGLMLDSLRHISITNEQLHAGIWKRNMGRRIATSTIGIIGVGRIGSKVITSLQGGFPGVKIIAYDTNPSETAKRIPNVQWVNSIDALLSMSDVVSLHVPLTAKTLNLIGKSEFSQMKDNVVLINTARGGIVNELALYEALRCNSISMAAMDVFEKEPYNGPLNTLPNIILTSHLGSMSSDCRGKMERGATLDAINFIKGHPFKTPVPNEEYQIAQMMKNHNAGLR